MPELEQILKRKRAFLIRILFFKYYILLNLTFLPTLPFCMMFSTKGSKADINFQHSLLSHTELSHKTQQKTCVISNRKSFDISLSILNENTEKRSI